MSITLENEKGLPKKMKFLKEKSLKSFLNRNRVFKRFRVWTFLFLNQPYRRKILTTLFIFLIFVNFYFTFGKSISLYDSLKTRLFNDNNLCILQYTKVKFDQPLMFTLIRQNHTVNLICLLWSLCDCKF